MSTESSERWLVFVPLTALAAVVALLVLVELQVLNLQRTVDSLVVEHTAEDVPESVADGESEVLVATDIEEGAGQVTQGMGVQVYTNDTFNYQFSIPQGTNVRHHQDQVIFTGQVDFSTNATGWVQADLDEVLYLDAPPSKIVTINGQQAAVFSFAQGYCDGPGCGDPFLAYGFLSSGNLVTIAFPGDIELSKAESDILNSFTFVE